MSTTNCRTKSMRARMGLGFVALLLSAAGIAAPPLPAEDTHAHLGPTTCASSVCHGRANPTDTTSVMQHEFRIWSREDSHSRAYNTLLSDRSLAIAKRLGLPDAKSAKVCLDCHADNVPDDRRGAQFQLTDGVGCEACHGGSGEWIKSHAEKNMLHAENVSKGLYPTDEPGARATLCLSCHLGTSKKFASHDMMAAGHPRLTFEMVAFTANQPAHYVVDDDYIQRKGDVSTSSMWAQGLTASVKAQMELLRSDRFASHGLFPEPAFFDCHACHHPMDDVRWAPSALHAGLAPGAIRLNDGNLVMLVALGQAISPSRGAALEKAGNAVHRASGQGVGALRDKASAMIVQVDAIQADIAARKFTPEELRSLRTLLLTRARDGMFRDFVAAEQAFLAVETLSIELGDVDVLRPRLDKWFATVRDENRFDHRGFSAQAGQLAKSLK